MVVRSFNSTQEKIVDIYVLRMRVVVVQFEKNFPVSWLSISFPRRVTLVYLLPSLDFSFAQKYKNCDQAKELGLLRQ